MASEFDGEMIVYDMDSHRAHCLNRTAALVFEHCDGTRSPKAVAQLLSDRLDAPVDERLVLASLDRLSKCKLLAGPAPAWPARGVSRREFVKTLGATALVAAPIITTIVAPTPATANSGPLPNGSVCTAPSQCQSGQCTGNIVMRCT